MYDFLTDVKQALKITGTYHDKTLNVYINDVKDYLLRAGVSKELVESQACSGAIVRGVSDLMSGNNFSNYFYDRVSQLSLTSLSNKVV